MEETEDSEDLFYFESDHLAIKGNKEYNELMKVLLILYAQRQQTIEDLKQIVALKQQALRDPYKMLKDLSEGVSINVPGAFELPEIPKIDWNSYSTKVSPEKLKKIYKGTNESPTKINLVDSNKSKTNGRWTVEEQKRLEELLQIYPPEPIEHNRFRKIAKELGRTIPQVASRVQKYFIKLYQAGLPIPGRIPKCGEKYKKQYSHRHQRYNHYLWKPTTFFPDYIVPVAMNEEDPAPGPPTTATTSLQTVDMSTNDNYLLPHGKYNVGEDDISSDAESDNNQTIVNGGEDDVKPEISCPVGTFSSAYDVSAQLKLLKQVKLSKLMQYGGNSKAIFHTGFKCDFCGEDPIIGDRWHCITCTESSIDYCTDCVVSQMYSKQPHPSNHCIVNAVLHSDVENVANIKDECALTARTNSHNDFEMAESSSSNSPFNYQLSSSEASHPNVFFKSEPLDS